ncbi:hypothetical protein LguiA_004233 [Lonicera macranthoides]
MKTPPQKQGPAIGIDLGTSYSCVAVYQNDNVEIIPNEFGNRTTPSYVAFTNSGRLIGDSAKNQVNTNPRNTVYDSKRLIGRRFSDPGVQRDLKNWPFKVVNGAGDRPVIVVKYNGEEKELAPEEIAAMILGKMRDMAEEYIGLKVSDAVLTVPACFNSAQRQAMINAGIIAGLNIMRIISEPTAAVLAYGLQKGKDYGEKNVLVFDLGAGAFNVGLFTIEEGIFDVKASIGYTHLGGKDFVNRVVKYFVEEFERKYKKNINGDARALTRLWNSCERAKKTLSTNSQAVIEIDSFFEGIDFHFTLSREKFERLNMFLFYECLELVEKCLRDSRVHKDDVDEIVLVGGSTRIPKVQQLLRDLFNGKELCKGINQDEAVAYGASVHAAILSGEGSANICDILVLNVTPLSLGFEINEGFMTVMLPRNTAMPTMKEKMFMANSLVNEKRQIRVYEGEELRARDNDFLGELDISWISINDEICVRFDIDAYGILIVSAEDKKSGKKSKISITNEGRLSKEEVKRMVKEGGRYRAEDEKHKKNVESRNELETLAYEMKKSVEEMAISSKPFAAAKKRFVLEAVEEVIQWLDGNPVAKVEEFDEKRKELHILCDPYLS